MGRRYYLAYGSNLNTAQMAHRCPGAIEVGTAVIKDYRLLFRGSKSGSYLTIEPYNGGQVPVAVWMVTAADERRLDLYEGFPHFYHKDDMKITYKDVMSKVENTVTAFVYIMNENRPFGLPSRSYIQACTEGYHDFGFDTSILEQAVLDTYKESINE